MKILFTNDHKIELDVFEEPEQPTTPLTEEQREKMQTYFPNHSYSKLDAKGRILLGGGEEPRGKFYTTPEILEQLP